MDNLQSVTFTAGQVRHLPGGNSLLLRVAREPVTVTFFRHNQIRGVYPGVQTQFAVNPTILPGDNIAFDRVEIKSATAQTIEVYVDHGRVSDPGGQGGNLPNARVLSQTALTGAAAAVAVINANANRLKATIQVTTTTYFGDDAAVDDSANRGIKLEPGETLTDDNTAALYAYAPANSSVIVIEETRA